MNKVLSRIVGVTLIIAAIGGMLFSVFGIYITWRYKPQVTESLQYDIELASDTLDATLQGLQLTRSSLEIANSSLSALQNTIEATASAFESTTPMLDTIISLTQSDLPNSITAVQGALESAKSSAQIIDSVLSVLTIFNRNLYNPSVPLHESLQQISDSLDNIPQAFATMETSLSDAKENLETIQAEIDRIASDINDINTSLDEYDEVVAKYVVLVEDLQGRINRLENNLPTYTNTLAVMITIFFIWMFVAQLGLLTQGLDLWRKKTSADQSKMT